MTSETPSTRIIAHSQSQLQDEIDHITASYIFNHPGFFRVAIEKDAALKNKTPEEVERLLLFYPGVIAVAVHEEAHKLNAEGRVVEARELAEAAHSRTGIDIHPGTVIGENLFIDHGTGTVIGETARIGKDTQIMHKVTLGAFADPKETDANKLSHRHPEIGDDCFLSVGVEMLGNVKVGNNVQVGPQATIYGNDIKIGNDVRIGADVKIYDGCTVADGVRIKHGAFIHPDTGLIDKNIPAHSTVFRLKSGELQIIEPAPHRVPLKPEEAIDERKQKRQLRRKPPQEQSL